MTEDPEKIVKTAALPLWLKVSCLIFAVIVLLALVTRRNNNPESGPTPPHTNKRDLVFPKNLETIWPEITLSVVGVARVNSESIVAEWEYINNTSDIFSSFSWGFAKPNYVALTVIIDAAGKEYSISTNKSGAPACSSTNSAKNEKWSEEIFGERKLSAWAQIDLPSDARQPFRLRLHGLNHEGRDEVDVSILSIEEQTARIYLPRATSWPDVFIQLVGIERDDKNTVRLTWDYLNTNEKERFIWGLNQPNFVAYTQIYDYETGKYHNVQRVFQNEKVHYTCSDTNKEDNSGWSKAIPPEGEMRVHATFKNVPGKNIQILFHSAMPLFYNPRKEKSGKPLLTN